ncbi:MAG: DUF3568 family protein [Planctomycetota bacterium]|jgi:hypothetical protein
MDSRCVGRKQLVAVLVLICSAVTLTGCTALLVGGAAAAGAGSVAYVRGDLETTEEVSLETAWQAAHVAATNLELTELSGDRNGLSARVVARTTQDEKVTIMLEPRGQTTTRVSIRVGFFGNESKSLLVLDAMRRSYDAA